MSDPITPVSSACCRRRGDQRGRRWPGRARLQQARARSTRGPASGSKGVVGTSTDFQACTGTARRTPASWARARPGWASTGPLSTTKASMARRSRRADMPESRASPPTSKAAVQASYGESLGAGPAVLGCSAGDAAVTGLHGDPHLEELQLPGIAEAGSSVRARRVRCSRDVAQHASPAVVGWGGVRGVAMSHPYAGDFEGDVQVSGNVLCHDIQLTGADCAERFDLVDADVCSRRRPGHRRPRQARSQRPRLRPKGGGGRHPERAPSRPGSSWTRAIPPPIVVRSH